MRPPHLLPLLASTCLLAGCPNAPDDTDPGLDDSQPADTGEADGCTVDSALLTDLSWEVTAVPSVIRAAWSLQEPAPSRVWFRAAEDSAWTATPTVPAGEVGEVLLVGMGSDAQVQLRVVAGEGDSPACSPLEEAESGASLPDRPSIDVLVGGEDLALDGYMLVDVLASPAHFWAILLDGYGRYVWAWEGENMMDRLLLAPDGQGLLYLKYDKNGVEDGGVQWIGFDGEEIEVMPFSMPGIDFAVLPDGRPAVLVEDVREVEHGGETFTVLGQALDVWAPEGGAQRLWSVWDVVQPDLSRSWPMVTTRNGTEAVDWAHLNGISYDPAGDDYYITSGNLNSVFAVDATSGENLWTLADDWGDWTVEDKVTLIEMPHSAMALEGGNLLVFNRYESHPGSCSDVAEISFDGGTGRATRVWTGQTEDCLHVEALGNAVRLASGDTVVSWSSVGQLDVLQPDSSSTLRLALGFGSTFGFVEPLSTLYPTADSD